MKRPDLSYGENQCLYEATLTINLISNYVKWKFLERIDKYVETVVV
jgi:hypothetical protein